MKRLITGNKLILYFDNQYLCQLDPLTQIYAPIPTSDIDLCAIVAKRPSSERLDVRCHSSRHRLRLPDVNKQNFP